jgi:hypothetical protein
MKAWKPLLKSESPSLHTLKYNSTSTRSTRTCAKTTRNRLSCNIKRVHLVFEKKLLGFNHHISFLYSKRASTTPMECSPKALPISHSFQWHILQAWTIGVLLKVMHNPLPSIHIAQWRIEIDKEPRDWVWAGYHILFPSFCPGYHLKSRDYLQPTITLHSGPRIQWIKSLCIPPVSFNKEDKPLRF